MNGMAIGYHRYSKSTFDSHKKRRWVLRKEDLDVTGFEDNKIYKKQTLCSQKMHNAYHSGMKCITNMMQANIKLRSGDERMDVAACRAEHLVFPRQSGSAYFQHLRKNTAQSTLISISPLLGAKHHTISNRDSCTP